MLKKNLELKNIEKKVKNLLFFIVGYSILQWERFDQQSHKISYRSHIYKRF